ncbi:hypothetical protein HDU97_003234, partial [Phlyctochytrium planicorne]
STIPAQLAATAQSMSLSTDEGHLTIVSTDSESEQSISGRLAREPNHGVHTQFSGSLPMELLDQIFQRMDSLDDLLSCALVSKAYFQSAVAFLWRRKTIWSDNWDTIRSLFSRPRALFFDYRQLFMELQLLTPSHRSSIGFPPEPPNNPPFASLYTPAIGGSLSSPAFATGIVPADALLPRRGSRDSHRSASPSGSASSSSHHEFGRLQGFRRFLQGCSRLMALNCDYPGVNDEDLWVISRACPSLQALSVVSSPVPAGRVGDEGLLALTTHCSELRHLRLRVVGGFACFTDRGFDAIAKTYKGRLLTFALEWLGLTFRGSDNAGRSANAIFSAVPTMGPQNPFESGTPMVAPGGSYTGPGGSLPLDRNLAGDSIMPLESAVKRFSESLCIIIQSNPNLKNLSLDWPIGVMETLEAAGSSLSNLESLRVGNFADIPILAKIIAGNVKLTRLCLMDLPSQFDCSALFHEAALMAARKNENQSSLALIPSVALEFLATPDSPMANLREIQLDGVGRLTALLDMIGAFRNLTRLKISASRMSASLASTPSDQLAATAFSLLPRLISVEVPIFGPLPLDSLRDNCPDLEELDVVDGSMITDQSLILLIKSCTKIRQLYLGSATNLVDTSIGIIARTLGSNLEHLALPFGNRNITSKAVETLSKYCPSLESLSNVTASVTYDQLLEWLPHCRKLRTLGLSISTAASSSASANRFFLSREEQDSLKSVCRHLKTIYYHP